MLKAKFRFNRPIDTTKDFICIGGFAATAAGKQYQFDFMTYYGNVDKKDPTILDYEGEGLDTEVFSDSAELVKYAENIESLDECSIDTDDDTLYLVEVLEFTLVREAGSVSLRPEILEDFNFRHILEMAEEIPKEGLSVDGDTILKDQFDELFDEDYTGIYDEIIGIWKETKTEREKALVKKMFETFIGIRLKEYLEKCIDVITKKEHDEY